MDRHRNAPLTPKGREMTVRAVVDCGLTRTAAARKFNTTPKTVAKWIARFEAEGVEGLRDQAERFIQTSVREWAYVEACNSSPERTAELPRWLHRYNWHRPHASIRAKPPISRLDLAEDNLLRLHS